MRLTTNKSWELCLKQWGWIIRQLKKDGTLDVEDLKEEWCKANGYEELDSNCFFCEYARQHRENVLLPCGCPAKKIDKKFDCLGTDYHYTMNPFAFYKKLKQLNRIRLKGK
jgi:hypothetical protein